MAETSKWVAADSPDQPVVEVARRALQARLDLVWQYLPQAAKGPHDDIELVHQLRVATRRAIAAIEIFADLLSVRRRKWFEWRLKQVRKAAGDARDFDVFSERLAQRLEQQPDRAIEQLLSEVASRRQDAQAPIDEALAKLKRKKFPRRQKKLVRHVRLRTEADRSDKPSFADAGVRALGRLVQQFFSAAAGNLSDPQALHAFRIQGKRLRYAMEVFADAFPPELRKKLYPQVERLQEKLGEINDHATARRHLTEWSAATDDSRVAASLRQLAEEEATSLGESTAKFFEWWTPKRRRRLRAGFARLLGEADDAQEQHEPDAAAAPQYGSPRTSPQEQAQQNSGKAAS